MTVICQNDPGVRYLSWPVGIVWAMLTVFCVVSVGPSNVESISLGVDGVGKGFNESCLGNNDCNNSAHLRCLHGKCQCYSRIVSHVPGVADLRMQWDPLRGQCVAIPGSSCTGTISHAPHKIHVQCMSNFKCVQEEVLSSDPTLSGIGVCRSSFVLFYQFYNEPLIKSRSLKNFTATSSASTFNKRPQHPFTDRLSFSKTCALSITIYLASILLSS